jgi:uracil-DNA glycosylase
MAPTAIKRSAKLALLEQHQRKLAACTRCPQMGKPVVMGAPVPSPVLLVGQAPGDKEPIAGKPFAWTAGKNLFKWFGSLGVDEESFRARVYMAAVCRCFPGKNPKGGDRVPAPDEIENCAPWMEREIELLQPRLIIPVGKLAIERFLPAAPLAEIIGRAHAWRSGRRTIDVIPLPHPSGASTWYHVEPGKTLTREALALISAHPAWQAIREG